jgi:hypothetical protein
VGIPLGAAEISCLDGAGRARGTKAALTGIAGAACRPVETVS